MPKDESIRSMMLNFERRLVWRWALKDKSKNEGQMNTIIEANDEVTAYFGQIDPVLQAWLGGLRSSILTAARRARAVHKRRDCFKHAFFGKMGFKAHER